MQFIPSLIFGIKLFRTLKILLVYDLHIKVLDGIFSTFSDPIWRNIAFEIRGDKMEDPSCPPNNQVGNVNGFIRAAFKWCEFDSLSPTVHTLVRCLAGS